MEITFEQLPKAVSQLFTELADIKKLLSQNSPAPSNENELLTIQEASKLLNLAAPTIYALVGKREIPFMKAAGGRRLYFLKKELTDWVKSGRKKTIAEIQAEATSQTVTRNKKG